MTLIKWTDEFSLGIDEVDEEHKSLIELINGLYDVIQVGADYVQVVELLGEIYSQIAVHFAHEEDMMQESGYAHFEEHREDHETLLDDLREIMDEVEADGSFDVGELSGDLNRWFVDHFRTHDARLYLPKAD
ncbi:MAG TPA: bacteriohemerythrin [Woeseiaceae bacterium]|jgi:hemerythrin-like metal-binding protein|nr:bacteriohemerythrin [Woeseiaceae bacterium]